MTFGTTMLGEASEETLKTAHIIKQDSVLIAEDQPEPDGDYRKPTFADCYSDVLKWAEYELSKAYKLGAARQANHGSMGIHAFANEHAKQKIQEWKDAEVRRGES